MAQSKPLLSNIVKIRLLLPAVAPFTVGWLSTGCAAISLESPYVVAPGDTEPGAQTPVQSSTVQTGTVQPSTVQIGTVAAVEMDATDDGDAVPADPAAAQGCRVVPIGFTAEGHPVCGDPHFVAIGMHIL